MKITATKKTITILIISSVLFLISGLTLLYKDVILNGIRHGNWYVLDQNQELLNICDHTKEKGLVNIKCRGLLTGITNKEGSKKNCYLLKILPTQEPYELKDITFCETNKSVNWDNPYLNNNYTKMIPVNMDFIYKRKNPGFFNFLEGEFNVMENEDIFNMYGDGKFSYNFRQSIESEYLGEEFYNNFYFGDEPHYNEFGLRRLAFVSGEVMDIRVDGEEMELDIRTMLRGKEIILRVHTGGFGLDHLNLPEEEGYTLITFENYHLVPKGIKVLPNFLFKERDTLEDDKEGLSRLCNGGDEWEKRTYCSILEDFDRLSDIKTLGIQDKDGLANLILENLENDSNIFNFDIGILNKILYRIDN